MSGKKHYQSVFKNSRQLWKKISHPMNSDEARLTSGNNENKTSGPMITTSGNQKQGFHIRADKPIEIDKGMNENMNQA